MLKVKKILFPTDFSRCANQALARAHNLVKRFGAELHMLHAMVLHADDPHNPLYHVPNVEEIHGRVQAEASEKMESLLKSHDTDGMKIVRAQERGVAPAPVILDYAKEHDIDLIVMGTHGRRGLGHLFLGSVAEEVVRLAECPVLTIREQEDPPPADALHRILVPIDFSEHSRSAIVYASEVAKLFGATLQFLHVVEETIHPAFYATGKVSIFELVTDLKDRAQRAMQKLRDELVAPKIQTEYHLTEGRAARDISKFAAEHDSDLIVISTHGLTGIEHLLLGSVAEKVVRMAPCPVLTVKSFGKSLL